MKISTQIVLFLCILTVQFSFILSNFPPNIVLSWAWPPGPNLKQWDWTSQPFENLTVWKTKLKPAIQNDIESYILEILNATGTQFAHRRYALSLKLSLPVMIMPEIRVIAVIQRMMELAIEVDLPLTFEFVGYVWWDFGCSPSPTCKGIWYPPNNANWEDVVEWWGWSSNYVWTHDNVSNPLTQYRNWGAWIQLHFPCPNFNSAQFRQVMQKRIIPFAQEIGRQYEILQAMNKVYLLTGIVTENEVGIGTSFSPNIFKNGWYVQYGVNVYRQKKCPNNVLDCLPPKPSNYSSAQWIQLQSEQFYRPSDFGDVLQEACHEYLTWVTELIYNHSNLPSNKLFAHSVIMANVQFGNSSKIIYHGDVALNPYSVPGYSIYFPAVDNPIEKLNEQYLHFLLVNRKVKHFSIVEYLMHSSYSDWLFFWNRFTNSSDLPIAVFICLQNWDRPMIFNNSGGRQTDPGYVAGVNLIRNLISTWTPVCGNDVIEEGEDCDGTNLDRRSCSSFSNYSGGTLQCSPKCHWDFSKCIHDN